MGYKEKLLKQIEELRKFQKMREENLGKALEFHNLINVKAAAEQVSAFTLHIKNAPQRLICPKDEFNAFINNHPELFPNGTFPYITNSKEGEYKIPNVDFGKIFDALEQEYPESLAKLEKEYEECDSKYREIAHPLTDLTTQMKESVDGLINDKEEALAIKEALDYANEEIIDKIGENIVDNAIDLNGNKRSFEAVIDFPNFIKKNGLDKNKVVNHSESKAVINPGFTSSTKYLPDYKEIFHMDLTLSDEFKKKIIGLDNLLKEEGLLQNAVGGETDFKEYGMADYFMKNYATKAAIVNHSKLTTDEEKANSLRDIKQKVDELKEVSKKYDKVFNYIKDNFDINEISLPINLYAGRAQKVRGDNLESWRPNLPPKYDNENAAYSVILSGFSQLKAACQNFNSSLEDYINHPIETYLNQAKTIGEKEDQKYYLPRSEENTLGKRMARALVTPSKAYEELSLLNAMGGRGTEFLYNVSDKTDKTNDNIIVANINKEYVFLYSHSPEQLFGRRDMPDMGSLKNLFANGDNTDKLYELSEKYVSPDTIEKGPLSDKYIQGIKNHKNVPIEQEYKRIMDTLKDYNNEKNVIESKEVKDFAGRNDYYNSYSFGTMLFAGREYFTDYLRENKLSLASIEDKKLREEITNFIIDPIKVTTDKYVKEADLAPETKIKITNTYNRDRAKNRPTEKIQGFINRFNDLNNKPNNHNRGKIFTKILSSNRGNWYERWRGTTSKEYTALQKISAAIVDTNSPAFGDYGTAYNCAIAYKNYKMPEGVRYEDLKDIEKRRIDFCNTIIKAYEDEHKPQVQIEDNNIIDNTKNFVDNNSFQKQLENDIENKAEKSNNIEIKEPKEEKQIDKSIEEETL